MINLLYIDLFCGAGGTSTGVEHARLGNAVEVNMARVMCEALVREIYKLKNF
jgi:site-specific DNA-cytosine methylase